MDKRKELSGIPITIKDKESFEWGCCGCKMVHHVHVRTNKKQVTLRVFIDEYQTGRERQKIKK